MSAGILGRVAMRYEHWRSFCVSILSYIRKRHWVISTQKEYQEQSVAWLSKAMQGRASLIHQEKALGDQHPKGISRAVSCVAFKGNAGKGFTLSRRTCASLWGTVWSEELQGREG